MKMESKKRRTKTVGISQKHSTGEDEAYGEWFTCPQCKESLICTDFIYCPGCGKKIRWALK